MYLYKRNFKQLFLACLLLFSVTTYPISPGAARFGSVVTGAVMGVPALFFPDGWKLISLPLFGLGFILGNAFLYQFTPAGRIENAEYELNKIASHRLVNNRWKGQELLEAVDDIYITRKWPLIAAFNDLTTFINVSVRVHDLANKAAREDQAFAGRAAILNRQADIFSDNITSAIKTIKKSNEYLEQLHQFEENRRHQEEMDLKFKQVRAQKESADAQHKIAEAQMLNAKAQQEIATAQKQIAATSKDDKKIEATD